MSAHSDVTKQHQESNSALPENQAVHDDAYKALPCSIGASLTLTHQRNKPPGSLTSLASLNDKSVRSKSAFRTVSADQEVEFHLKSPTVTVSAPTPFELPPSRLTHRSESRQSVRSVRPDPVVELMTKLVADAARREAAAEKREIAVKEQAERRGLAAKEEAVKICKLQLENERLQKELATQKELISHSKLSAQQETDFEQQKNVSARWAGEKSSLSADKLPLEPGYMDNNNNASLNTEIQATTPAGTSHSALEQVTSGQADAFMATPPQSCNQTSLISILGVPPQSANDQSVISTQTHTPAPVSMLNEVQSLLDGPQAPPLHVMGSQPIGTQSELINMQDRNADSVANTSIGIYGYIYDRANKLQSTVHCGTVILVIPVIF